MREYLLTLCITAAVTYLLTGPVRKFAIVAGAMPEIRARDVHREPTPRLGGIAMFFGLCAGLLVADHLPNLNAVFENSNEPRALLSGAALIWLIGVLDDKFEIDALIKLGGQMIAAGVMVMQGLTILWIPVPGVGTVSLTSGQGTLLTVALVVITINAVNFVDGLDGLAAGMVCIASAASFMYAYRIWYGYGIEAAAPATLFAAILMGMCLGFLPHNMHPARIFMGDSGSMLIGLILAAGAISVTGQVDPAAMKLNFGTGRDATHAMLPVFIPLLMPLTIIAIPFADLVLAIVRRTWNGKSPFAADRGHLHHRLLEIGHSHSRLLVPPEQLADPGRRCLLRDDHRHGPLRAFRAGRPGVRLRAPRLLVHPGRSRQAPLSPSDTPKRPVANPHRSMKEKEVTACPRLSSSPPSRVTSRPSAPSATASRPSAPASVLASSSARAPRLSPVSPKLPA
ncbi:Undecaprenyl-phosphate alpha-N-acetylglucosaminyl 1-phosphate transferase [Streptomyces alboniger]